VALGEGGGLLLKVKVTLEQVMKAQRRRRRGVLLVTSAFDWGGWSTPRSGHFTSGKETQYSFYRSLG